MTAWNMNGSQQELHRLCQSWFLDRLDLEKHKLIKIMIERNEAMQRKADNRSADCTPFENKALLSVKEMCIYLSIGQTKCRELLSDPANGFTVRIGNRLYAHRKNLDNWLKDQIY